MHEHTFGAIRFIPGGNRGRYPCCHSIYIAGAGVLIDPASDRERLARLRGEEGVREVWLSHWHEDHFTHLDLFDDLPLRVSAPDAPMLSGMEQFLDGYGIDRPDHRAFWRRVLTEQFHFKPRTPSAYLSGGQVVDLGPVTVEILETPGHTPGHLAFLFREEAVLFMGDYDLTAFGPWYGDTLSSIPQTIASVERLRQVPARVRLTGHEKGIFETEPGDLWERYLGVIAVREARLLELLAEPKTLEEIAGAWIVYGRPRDPVEFFAFGEQAIMKKHLEQLTAQGRVVAAGPRWVRAERA